MTFDMNKTLEGKQELRERLARLPVAEKLRMLDALRERQVTIREAATRSRAGVVRESSPGDGVCNRKD